METTFSNTSDICQQLLDRYGKSSAQQHRHLCATAAATRSLIHSESLPLTPFSYFAAAISTLSDQNPHLDPQAFAALSSFLTIVLPLVPDHAITRDKAREAVEVVAGKINGDVNEAFLGTATVRALIKSLGALLGFCVMEDWDSIKLGFSILLSFSIDKRPKVRKCAQDCLVALFKSLGPSGVVKQASKIVYSFLKEQMPSTIPENQELVHTLNVLKIIVPHLSVKLCAKVLDQLMKFLRCESASLSKHVFEIILVMFETSTFEVTDADAGKLLGYLVSYISLKEKHPLDSVLCAASLSRRVMDNLHARNSTESISLLPPIINAVASLLSSEAGTAVQASTILKGLINQHVDENLVSATDCQLEDDKSSSCKRLTAVKSICRVFDDLLKPGVVPNDYLLGVVSALFLRIGEASGFYMKSILAKLAEVLNSPSVESSSDIENLKKCIGTSVVAMGPKNFLALLPISLSSRDFSCSNMWVLPILKEYIVGSSLQFFMEYFVTLADSFQEEAEKVGRSEISKKLEVYANKCWELLPAFCRFPNDMHKNFTSLAKLLVPCIKDSPVLEIIAASLQELVNQNKQILACDDLPGEILPQLENIPEDYRSRGSYSKKIANKNIRALASCSKELLQAFVDVFMELPSDRHGSLKDAIGCLASISDPSMIKNTFLTSLKKLQLIKDFGESLELESLTNSSSGNKESKATSIEKDAERCLVLKLGSCFADWASDELINFLFKVTCHSLEVTEGTGLLEAYQTLSSILEKHAAFCSSQFGVLDLLLKLKSPSDIASLRSRFYCLRTLLIHALEESLDEENTKAFLILNEIIIALKDSAEEGRKAAYNILAEIGASLRSISSSTSEGIYQKLINMVMGYLVDSSPHIKSGAVSALSVLVYSDTDICVVMPELVPSVLRLLQEKKKVIEVIKAVLGFVKVLVSDLQAKDLRNFLPDIVNGILPWASKSRYHFKLKVTIILEIMTRKCGAATVKSLVPQKYRDFLESVLQNCHGKTSSKGTSINETELKPSESSQKGSRKRTHEESTVLPKEGSKVSRKRPRESRQKGSSSTNGVKEPNQSPARVNAQKSVGRKKENPERQRSVWQGRNNRESAPKTQLGEKRKMHGAETTKKDKSGRPKPAAELVKTKRVSKKRMRVEK